MIKASVITFLKTFLALFLLSIIFIIPSSAQNNSVWTINSSFLNTLPFRGENNLYYTLFPGVTSQDFRGNDLLYMRGSRHDELAYYINGIDIRSDYTGLPLFRIIPQALDNITIDKAPSVSMSNARAVVTHELKQGGETPLFSLNSETDKFTPLYEQRLDTYSYGYNNLTLTGGGTIPKSETEIFIAGEKESFADHYRMFWDGFHITDEDMDLTFITDRYTVYSGGILVIDTFTVVDKKDELLIKPGNIPSADLGRTTINGIITQPFLNGYISFVTLYENETKRINNTPIFHMFNQKRLPETNRKAQLYSLQGEYNFPFDLKLNLQADFLRSRGSTYDPNFGDDFWKYSDSTALANAGIPYVSGYGNMQVNYFDFSKPGREITGYSKQNENYKNFKFELTKSINNHAIRLGGNYKISEYRFFSMWTYTMRSLQQYMRFKSWTTIRDVPPNELEQFLFRNRVQGVGYNLFGEKITDESEYFDSPITPKKVSFYITDVISKGDWTTEFGLRYDKVDSDMLFYEDSTMFDSEYYYWSNLQEYNEGLIKQAPKASWSPRISIKYRTNDKLTSYLKLGKYVQFPQYKNIFIDKRHRALYGYGSGSSNNNPMAWDAEYTTSYQSSYKLNYLLNSNTNINIELYNISTNNYLQTGKRGLVYTSYNNYPEYIEYSTLLSDGSRLSRGIELNFSYRDTNLEAWINYNYSNVKGTSTYPISNYAFTYPDNWWRDSTDYVPPQRNIDSNNQHSAVGFVAYKYGEEENVLLKNVTVSALGRFDSGHPYTLWEAGWGGGYLYEGGRPPPHANMQVLYDPAYGNTTPWRFSIDLKIDKTIKIGKTGELTFYVYAQNILNKKNVNHVYWKTGNTVDDGSSEIFEFHKENFDWFDDFYTLYELINIEHRQYYRNSEGGDLFGRPREIRFGISFNY